ncbi:MAG: hypothetical protein ABR599_06685 [Gemmatimonadota bacterium]
MRADGDPDCLLVATGRIVVQFAPGMQRDAMDAELERRGARVVRELSYLPNGFLVDGTAAPAGALALANELHEQPFVVAAEPNWRRRTRRR